MEVLPSLLIASLLLLGMIPASVARQKGHSMARWWTYGTLLFPVALIHALLLRRIDRTDEAALPSGKKECAYCKELLPIEDESCPNCLLRQYAPEFDSRGFRHGNAAAQ